MEGSLQKTESLPLSKWNAWEHVAMRRVSLNLGHPGVPADCGVVMQINDDFYEDLTPESTVKILDALAKGERPKPGPQSGRKTSENSAGLTS